MTELDYDVFIAGSGPIGATYARHILEHHKSARILMVEVGSQESPIIGANLKNSIKYQRDLSAFTHIIRAAFQPVSIPPAGGFLPTLQGDVWSQPGSRSSISSPYNPDQDPYVAVGESVTHTVGGMATHWTCACPEPHDEELVECPIELGEMRQLLRRGKKLLNVHDDHFEHSLRHQLVKKALADAYAPRGIAVKSIPLAGERPKDNDTLFNWTGVDTILGDYIFTKDAQGRDRFKLLSECLVVKFITDPDVPDKVISALIRDLRTGRESNISAKVFVAACGVVCTPQLLWNSDIRHKALGHYFTTQSHTFCQVVLRRTLINSLKTSHPDIEVDPIDGLPIPLHDPEPQITIPYSAEHPFHTQFHRDAFSYGDVGPQIDQRVVLDIRYFGKLEVKESNYVSFSYQDRHGRPNTDIYDMPQPTFHFRTSAKDDALAQRMMREMCDSASVLGSYLPNAPPQHMGLGCHSTGTTRVGNDPKTSVANKNSRVRRDGEDLFKNLWVGGTSCIPDSTACNPTLTAVAYAIQGAEDLIKVLGAGKDV